MLYSDFWKVENNFMHLWSSDNNIALVRDANNGKTTNNVDREKEGKNQAVNLHLSSTTLPLHQLHAVIN